MAPIRRNLARNNSYEEARKLRLQENQKKLQDLGILSLSKSLSEGTKAVKKSLKPKLKRSNTSLDMVEMRRSNRVRHSITPYSEEFNIDLTHLQPRKRSKPRSWTSCIGRPLEDVRFASDKERALAMGSATSFKETLKSGNPNFIKSMLHSHVYNGFWLGLPSEFCQNHLPLDDLAMTLEDTDGSAYKTLYKGKKNGLSAGWRGYALAHKLDDGDAVVFELTKPDRFKVYIFRVPELHKKTVMKNGEKKAAKSVKREAADNAKSSLLLAKTQEVHRPGGGLKAVAS